MEGLKSALAAQRGQHQQPRAQGQMSQIGQMGQANTQAGAHGGSRADARPAPNRPTNRPPPVQDGVGGRRASQVASGGPVRDAAYEEAQRLARSAGSIGELADALKSFTGCGLSKTAKSTCVYRGVTQSRLMVIGEAPGRDEDLKGQPFVGRAGQLLDKMLAAIGYDENSVHITNIVYWRPPGNRAPTPQESLICRPFLLRQIELVDPDVILLMGGSSAKQMLETNEGIMKTRGKWRELDLSGRPRQVLATLHPAYLLRTPAAKHMAWKDLLNVQEKLS